jgi:hypothetical protein
VRSLSLLSSLSRRRATSSSLDSRPKIQKLPAEEDTKTQKRGKKKRRRGKEKKEEKERKKKKEGTCMPIYAHEWPEFGLF